MKKSCVKFSVGRKVYLSSVFGLGMVMVLVSVFSSWIDGAVVTKLIDYLNQGMRLALLKDTLYALWEGHRIQVISKPVGIGIIISGSMMIYYATYRFLYPEKNIKEIFTSNYWSYFDSKLKID